MENGPRTSMPTLDFVLNLKAPAGPLGHPLAIEIQKPRPRELPGLAVLAVLAVLVVVGALWLGGAPAPAPVREPEVASMETAIEEVKEVQRVVSEHAVQAPVSVEETVPARPLRRVRRRAGPRVEAPAVEAEAPAAATSLEDLMRRASGEDPLR